MPRGCLTGSWCAGETFLLDKSFLRWCKQGCIQFVIAKPVLAIFTLVLDSQGVYGKDDWGFDKGFVYIQVIYNISYTWALYALAIFYSSAGHITLIGQRYFISQDKACLFFTQRCRNSTLVENELILPCLAETLLSKMNSSYHVWQRPSSSLTNQSRSLSWSSSSSLFPSGKASPSLFSYHSEPCTTQRLPGG